MFYWIYDLPALWVIVLFEAVFVGVFWLGTLFLHPFVRSWLKEEPRLNDMLAISRFSASSRCIEA